MNRNIIGKCGQALSESSNTHNAFKLHSALQTCQIHQDQLISVVRKVFEDDLYGSMGIVDVQGESGRFLSASKNLFPLLLNYTTVGAFSCALLLSAMSM